MTQSRADGSLPVSDSAAQRGSNIGVRLSGWGPVLQGRRETNSSCLAIEVCVVPPQTVQSMEYIFSYLAVGVGFTAVGNSNGNRGGDHHTGLRRVAAPEVGRRGR